MSESSPPIGPCTIADPRVARVLDRLHEAAGRQTFKLARLLGSVMRYEVFGRQSSVAREVERLKNLDVPVPRKQGRMLYLVARSVQAKRIVEFGTSFGVSTTYLAAAVRDNGGGVVVGSEIEPGKVAAARRNLDEAGLGSFVEIREGDARRTLADPGGTVDMLLLNGYLPLYVPILTLLAPALRQGAAVLAANALTFRWMLAPYVAYVRDPANGFLSLTLFVGDGLEYAVRL